MLVVVVVVVVVCPDLGEQEASMAPAAAMYISFFIFGVYLRVSNANLTLFPDI